MSNILSQEEVNVLLKGISVGDIDTLGQAPKEPYAVVPYDLVNRNKIFHSRLPGLEMAAERFARIFRISLSVLLREGVQINVLSVESTKFGEFLKTHTVPTSLNIFRIDPLRGSALFVLESRVVFTFVDILFGGKGGSTYQVEGREFTAIESGIIRKIVLGALGDLEKALKDVLNVKVVYQRPEFNPQFAQIVSPSDAVFVVHYEIEMECATGALFLCIPHAVLEPVREKLQTGFQGNHLEIDREWARRLRGGLMASRVELVAELGKAEISMKDVLGLKKGDVVLLDRFRTDCLDILVEGILKFHGHPGVFRGNNAVQVSDTLSGREVHHDGAE
jgi:flagellar motor switch protein FliM